MLTVYGDIRSGNCLKVKWLLDRLGRDYRWVETDVMSGVTRSPEFLARNPAGQVPAVVLEDGRVLAQSNAIIGWLGEGTAFIPPDPWDRARMYEWLFWEQYSHEPCIAVVRFQRLLGGKAVALTLPRGAMLESVAFASDDQTHREGGFLQPWPLDAASAAGAGWSSRRSESKAPEACALATDGGPADGPAPTSPAAAAGPAEGACAAPADPTGEAGCGDAAGPEARTMTVGSPSNP